MNSGISFRSFLCVRLHRLLCFCPLLLVLTLETTVMKVPGPPCSRPNGMQDWGPESGPRWRGCSEEASSTTSETSQASEYSSEAAETEEGAANGSDFAVQGGRLWMVVAAASVVSAVVAIAMGQRRPAATQQRHGMAGSVMRRVGAVSAFAAGAFPGRQQNKTVEMQTQGEGYRLDMAPEGGASVPSANV